MARGRDSKKDRMIELHLKGIGYEAIALRLGVTSKHVAETVNNYKRKQEANNVQTPGTK
jgi:transposase